MTIGSSQGQMAGSNNIAHGGMTGRCGDSNTSNTRNAAKNMKKNLISLNHRGRGVVYVSHIPHGFYEAEMNDFFRQFGTITNLLLARSKETGKSRGYAYIEFMYAEIAKVVADTMHNYLMNERLLKAKFIPSEEFNVQLFYQKNPTEKNFPHQENRKLNTQLHNRDVPAMGEVKAQRKRESQHEDLMNKITNEKPDFTFKVSHASDYANVALADSSIDGDMNNSLAELDKTNEFLKRDFSNVTQRKRQKKCSKTDPAACDFPLEKTEPSPPKKNRASILPATELDVSVDSDVETMEKNLLHIPSATKTIKKKKPNIKNDDAYESNDSMELENLIGKTKEVPQNSLNYLAAEINKALQAEPYKPKIPKNSIPAVIESNSNTNKDQLNMTKKKICSSSKNRDVKDVLDRNENSTKDSDLSLSLGVPSAKKSKRKKNVTNQDTFIFTKKLKSNHDEALLKSLDGASDNALTSDHLSVSSKQESNPKMLKKIKKDKNRKKTGMQKQKKVLTVKLQDKIITEDTDFSSDRHSLSVSSIKENLLKEVLDNVTKTQGKQESDTFSIHSEKTNKRNNKKHIKDFNEDVSKKTPSLLVPSFQDKPNIRGKMGKGGKKEKDISGAKYQTVINSSKMTPVQTYETEAKDTTESEPSGELDLSITTIANKVLAKVVKAKKNKKNDALHVGSENANTTGQAIGGFDKKTNDTDNKIPSDQAKLLLPTVGKQKNNKRNVIVENDEDKSPNRPSLSASEIRDNLLTEALKGKKKRKNKKTKKQDSDIGSQKNTEDKSSGRRSLTLSEIKLLTEVLKEREKKGNKTKFQTVNVATQKGTTEPNAKKAQKEKKAIKDSKFSSPTDVTITEQIPLNTQNDKIENDENKSPNRTSLSVIEIRDKLLTKALKEKKKGKKTREQISSGKVKNNIQQLATKFGHTEAVSALHSSLTSSVLENVAANIGKGKKKKKKQLKTSSNATSSQNVIDETMRDGGNNKIENSDTSFESSLSVSAIQDELLKKVCKESTRRKKEKNKNKISQKTDENLILNDTKFGQILNETKMGEGREEKGLKSEKTSKKKFLQNKENLESDVDIIPVLAKIELPQKVKGKIGKVKLESGNLHVISGRSKGRVSKVDRKMLTK